MNHSFNVDVAIKYGIEEAIIIENLAWWINKNIANRINFFENRVWTFNSSSAFNELFPYMNQTKIKRVLVNLEKENIIISGNFNKLKFDRTKWYTIIDECIIKMYKIDYNKMNNALCKMNNGELQNEPTIPDINSNINPYINKDRLINKKTPIEVTLPVTFGNATDKDKEEDENKDKNNIKIDIEKEQTNQSIQEYIKLVSESTGTNLFQIQQVINLSMLRDYDINLLILKIKESDFLSGKLETKPTIRNFVQKNMIDKIMIDFYKNNDKVKVTKKETRQLTDSQKQMLKRNEIEDGIYDGRFD